MRTDQAVQCRFEDELTALMARKQSSEDGWSRCALFDAVSDLECRALIGGASDLTLRKIAEIRFLAGILREAVRPFPIAPLRTVLRVRQRVDARSSIRAPTEADLGFV
ncbi:hypothetical protein [Methylobacterium sp. CM6257]|jgi:hypothetical protein